MKGLGRVAAAGFLAIAATAFAAGGVNINTADAKTLAKELDGVGDATAAKIVEERSKNGPFKDMKDLNKRVDGFGDKMASKNAERVRFKD